MTRMHTRITDQPHTRTTTYRRSAIIGTMTERCPYCSGTNIIRQGKREKKLETVQLWHCRDCVCVFTPQLAKGKTYPLKAILAGLSLYYSGRTTAQTTKLLKERYGLTLNPRTLGTWLTEYKPLTTYNRLREQGSKRFTSYQLIRSVRLHHQQVYMFRTHRAKLDLLLTTPEHRAFLPIAEYLTDVAEDCPHHLFQGEHRASAGKAAFNLDSVEIKERQNLAPRIASLVLQAVTLATIPSSIRAEHVKSIVPLARSDIRLMLLPCLQGTVPDHRRSGGLTHGPVRCDLDDLEPAVAAARGATGSMRQRPIPRLPAGCLSAAPRLGRGPSAPDRG